MQKTTVALAGVIVGLLIGSMAIMRRADQRGSIRVKTMPRAA